MSRSRSLLGGLTIASMMVLGMPSLASVASAGSEPPTTEPAAPDDRAADEQTDPTEPTTTEPPSATTTTVTAAPTTASTDVPAPSTEPAVTEESTTTTEPSTTTTTEADEPVEPPTAPQSVAAVPGNATVTLSWLEPSSPGTAPIEGYTISFTPYGGTWQDVQVPAGTTSRVFTGLNNGTRYYFRVTAFSADGSSPTMPYVSTVPRTVPAVPRSLVVTPANGSIKLVFSAPASNGGAAIDHYLVQRSTYGGPWTTVGRTPGGTANLGGLTNGVRYYVRVSAHNAAGYGPFSTPVSTVPRTVPSVPRALTATAGYAQATLRWTAPASNGGYAITGYTIAYAPWGGAWSYVNVPATAMSKVLTGLRPGTTYSFRVSAYGAIGRSPWTANVRAVPIPYRKPGAPSISSVTNGNRASTLRWSAPANTGGLPITGYTVQIWRSGAWRSLVTLPATTRAYTVGGLTNGTSYSLRVAAANRLGWGSWSAVVSARPVAPPPACDPAYPTICIPVGSPDLDCGDIAYRRFTVRAPDPHRFDADHDGVGCEV